MPAWPWAKLDLPRSTRPAVADGTDRTGALASAAGRSPLLLGPLGGKAALIYSTARVLDSEELNEALVFGLPDEVPLDSLVAGDPFPAFGSGLRTSEHPRRGPAVLSIALLIGQRAAAAAATGYVEFR